MILSISEQAELFLWVFAAGFAAGVFYDIIETFRKIIPHSKTIVYVEDIMYWIVVIVLLFLFLLGKNQAEIRLFDIIGFFLGMLIYGLTISRLVIRLLETALSVFRSLLKILIEIILTPLRLIWIPFSRPAKKIVGSADRYLKKVLHLGSVYAKIKIRRLNDQLRFIKRRRK